MTTIGILGTGRMAVRLAVEFARLGHSVVLGSRTPERATHIAGGLGHEGIRPGDYGAAAASEVVLPAIFLRDGLLETLRPFAPQFEGKLYLDITNPFNADYTDFILPWDTSAAEEVQRAFPRARVVGAFKNVWWEVFDAPRFDGPAELARLLVAREETRRCFVRQWMQFALHRDVLINREAAPEDRPSVDAALRAFTDSGLSLSAAIVAVSRTNSFLRP